MGIYMHMVWGAKEGLYLARHEIGMIFLDTSIKNDNSSAEWDLAAV